MCTWLALFLGGFCLYPLCGNSPTAPLGLCMSFLDKNAQLNVEVGANFEDFLLCACFCLWVDK